MKEYDYAAMQAELDELCPGIPSRAEYTEEMDFAIKHAYANGKNREAFSRWFKKRYGWGCRQTLNKRAGELGVL